MGFPVWLFTHISGGFLIALISVLHVFVAQFAIGGGFFLVLAERYGHNTQSRPILEWVQAHTRFFLLLTMVFGGLSGVAIWLIISLVAPQGVSFLIQHFVFIWAIEWAFFLGEILALLVYLFTFPRVLAGTMDKKDHVTIGWLYALLAWLSLFAINGIITFMLTPGAWLESRNLWDAFFNPSFFPSLFFRTGLCFSLAGLFGLLTCRKISDMEARQKMTRWCALWISVPFILTFPSAYWYWASLSPDVQHMILRRTLDIQPYLQLLFICGPILFLLGLAGIFLRSQIMAHPLVLCFLLLLGLLLAGSFEFVRETGRRPWLVYGYMYSNGILAEDAAKITKNGALAYTGWAETRTVTAENSLWVGRFLFAQQCSSCHGITGPSLAIVKRIAEVPAQGIDSLIAGQGVLRTYMPPFLGTEAERKALVSYLVSLHPETASPTGVATFGASSDISRMATTGNNTGVRHE